MRSRTIGAMALICAVVVGCGGQDVAAAYASAAAQTNLVLDARPDPTSGTLEEWHAWANRVIASDQAFAKTLQGLSFDARTTGDVHSLMTHIAAEISACTAIAQAGTVAEVRLAAASWPNDPAANLVRLDLGLPPAAWAS